jgi:hypothetical protein
MPTPRFERTMPKAWGKLINYSDGDLLLEGLDGSLRIVGSDGRRSTYPRIKALIKGN